MITITINQSGLFGIAAYVVFILILILGLAIRSFKMGIDYAEKKKDDR